MRGFKRLDVGALLGGPVRRLANVRRYAALRVGRIENVAEHSFYVALYALAIARDLRARRVDVDELLVLEGALCHDLDESVAGDLPRPFIKAVPGLRSKLDGVNARFVRGIGRELGVDVERGWVVQREGSLEGGVVALADVLEIVAYVGEEVRGGNAHLRGVAREVGEGLRASDFPEVLEPYVAAAQNWIERLDGGDVPGDREMIAKLLEEGEE